MSTFEIVLCFLWAFSEALFWPFMPDAVLVPLAALHPFEAWQLLPAAVLGSASGAIVSYACAYHSSWEHGLNRLNRLPLVRKPMIEQARQWLEREGPRGAWHQPLSFIPFKVFAIMAGLLKIPLVPFLFWSMLVRTTRFALVCLISASVGLLFARWLSPIRPLAILVWAIVFSSMLMRTVRQWERKGEP